MKKYLAFYPKNWKNHGKIMEFCQARKVGTLQMKCDWVDHIQSEDRTQGQTKGQGQSQNCLLLPVLVRVQCTTMSWVILSTSVLSFESCHTWAIKLDYF